MGEEAIPSLDDRADNQAEGAGGDSDDQCPDISELELGEADEDEVGVGVGAWVAVCVLLVPATPACRPAAACFLLLGVDTQQQPMHPAGRCKPGSWQALLCAHGAVCGIAITTLHIDPGAAIASPHGDQTLMTQLAGCAWALAGCAALNICPSSSAPTRVLES